MNALTIIPLAAAAFGVASFFVLYAEKPDAAWWALGYAGWAVATFVATKAPIKKPSQ